MKERGKQRAGKERETERGEKKNEGLTERRKKGERETEYVLNVVAVF